MVVAGAGIVGVTCALLLAEAGCDVALVEGDRVANGVTGYTTAKLSALQSTKYSELAKKFGVDGARAYATANSSALEWIAGRVERHGIDCDFRRRDAYTYAPEPGDVDTVEAEVRAARDAGLPVDFVTEVPLPYPTAGAARLRGQAEFHPVKYLLGLAAEFTRAGGRLYENSRAESVSNGSRVTLHTADCAVVARTAVIATHVPFLDRSLAFARAHPERSYSIAARGARECEGMFISVGSGPTRSLRSHPAPGGEYLLVGGEGHKTGQAGDTVERYERLEQFARERFGATDVEYRWSSQDLIPADGMPYVGAVMPGTGNLLMATGFSKWGLTNGTAAAIMLADRILGRENRWAPVFDSVRIKPVASAKNVLSEGLDFAKRFVGDRVSGPDQEALDAIERGAGAVVSIDGSRLAAHRDDGGALHVVDATCTHLGCQVAWNDAERSWDCPCHGSRFAPDGSVLEGPAVKPLERVDVTADDHV